MQQHSIDLIVGNEYFKHEKRIDWVIGEEYLKINIDRVALFL